MYSSCKHRLILCFAHNEKNQSTVSSYSNNPKPFYNL